MTVVVAVVVVVAVTTLMNKTVSKVGPNIGRRIDCLPMLLAVDLVASIAFRCYCYSLQYRRSRLLLLHLLR